MRGLAVAVVSSVFVHAVALAWVTARDLELPVVVEAAPPAPAPPPVATSASPPPIEVVFFDEATGAGSVGAASTAPAQRTGRIVRRGSTGGETPGTAPGGREGTQRSPYMTMRRPGDEPLKGLSDTFWAKFDANTKPLPPPPDIPGERVGDQIADLRARLQRAGRYSPDELAAMRAQLVALNAEREAEELKPAGGGTFETEKETFRAKVAADGSVKLEDKPENMDSQDKLMKSRGIDPYGRAKLAYLDRTREQRVAIGKRFRAQELKKSVVYIQGHIARLWQMTTDVAKRKQGLFELWDECSETGTPEEVEGGEAARAFVMAQIRATVRYTPDEVRALNAQRQSKQAFAP